MYGDHRVPDADAFVHDPIIAHCQSLWSIPSGGWVVNARAALDIALVPPFRAVRHAIRLADAHARSAAATTMYKFAWRTPQLDGRLGVCHSLEIPFVFDALGNGTEALWGTDPPQSLADTMHAAWVAFATNGDPGWPKYDLGRRATMRFDTTSEVVNDPRSAERALWEGVR